MTISSLILDKQGEEISENLLTIWPAKADSRFNHLPSDIITKVVSFLDKSEILELVKTCRDLRDKGVEAIKCCRIVYLTDCIDRLESLEEVPRVLGIFKQIYANTPNIQELAGIIPLTKHIAREKVKLIDTLWMEDTATLAAIDAINNVKPFAFLDLVSTYKEFKEELYDPASWSLNMTSEYEHPLAYISFTVAKKGMFDCALDLARSIGIESIISSSLTSIAKIFLQDGAVDKSLELLEESLSVAKTLYVGEFKQGIQDRYKKIFQIVEGFMEVGNLDRAYNILLDEFPKLQSAGGLRKKCEMYIKIAKAYLQTGENAQALEVLTEAQDVGGSFGHLNNVEIAKVLVKAGYPDCAFLLLQNNSRYLRSFRDLIKASLVLIETAKVYLLAGDTSRAISALGEAEEVANAVVDVNASIHHHNKCHLLADIAEVFLEIGDVDHTLHLLTQALQAKDANDSFLSCVSKSEVLRKVAGLYSKVGQEEIASELADKANAINRNQLDSLSNLHVSNNAYTPPNSLFFTSLIGIMFSDEPIILHGRS